MPFSSHFGPTSELLIARPVLTIGRVGFIGRIALFYYRFLISGPKSLTVILMWNTYMGIRLSSYVNGVVVYVYIMYGIPTSILRTLVALLVYSIQFTGGFGFKSLSTYGEALLFYPKLVDRYILHNQICTETTNKTRINNNSGD